MNIIQGVQCVVLECGSVALFRIHINIMANKTLSTDYSYHSWAPEGFGTLRWPDAGWSFPSQLARGMSKVKLKMGGIFS